MLDKIQISVKELRGATRHVSCGDCDLQNLLRFCDPVAYVHSRTRGWQCDVYELPCGITLSAGYTTYGTHLPYEFVEEYEKKATAILQAPGSYEKQREEMTRLLKSFCQLVQIGRFWEK